MKMFCQLVSAEFAIGENDALTKWIILYFCQWLSPDKDKKASQDF